MTFVKILMVIVLVILLTVVTQVGGVVLLIALLSFGWIDNKAKRGWSRAGLKIASFVTLYLVFVFAIVPLVARSFGRVPLPVFTTRNLQPSNVLTCLLNRHYVRPAMRAIALDAADAMSKKYPGMNVNYLDANFPFLNKFPLLPHLSHNDGKKLDLAFAYNDSASGGITNAVPSFIGYGICEEPKPGEFDMPGQCAGKGYSRYNKLREIVSQKNKPNFTFDAKRTKDLVNAFAQSDGIGRIFIEPHLKTRLGLKSNKIVFHGCQAVRHDDHIHVQLK